MDKLGLQAQQRMLYSFISLLPIKCWDDLSSQIHIRTKVIAEAYEFSYVFRIGDYVTMGGRAAVRDHVSIASKVWFCFPDLIRLSSHSLGALWMASD